MANDMDARALWKWLGPADPGLLVATDTPEVRKFGAASDFAFHSAYYTVEPIKKHLPDVATFIRTGLPPQLQFDHDDDFFYYINWADPNGWPDPVIEIGLDRILAGVKRDWLPSRARLSEQVHRALQQESYYLPDAVVEDEGEIRFELPLNADVALRLMLRDWLSFCGLYDVLLLSPDRRDRRFMEAARELSIRMHGLVGIDLRLTDGSGDPKLQPVLGVIGMQRCLPNSVTLAWAQLLDAVSRNATYSRCARTGCGRLFEQGRPDQLYCSSACGDAHRHARRRGAGDDNERVSITVRHGSAARPQRKGDRRER